MQIGIGSNAVVDEFIRILNDPEFRVWGAPPRVLEMGTKRWLEDFQTHHAHWLPYGTDHIKTDIEAGTDVDLVMDAHALTLGDGTIDALIAVAVWEHLARPWVAAKEVARVLTDGGIALIETHQTFPLHGYPHDYYRFSKEALSLIFEDAGMEVLAADYQYPCQIVPNSEVTRWNPGAPAFLNVAVLVRNT